MCNFCHIRIEQRAVQAVPKGESDEEFEEDESSKSQNLESNDGGKFSATLACSSRSDIGLTRRTARANQPYERRLEKKRKIDRYDCRGVVNVKVCIEEKEMEHMLTHLCPHPKPEYKGNFIPDAALRRIEEMAGTSIRRVDNVVHDWTGEEFQTEPDIGHPEPTYDTDDYLQKFKEKWLKLVQNTDYLVEKEHDNEKFIEAVDKALYSFDRAIGKCMTALRSGRQQQTWAKTGSSMWLR
ncbi:hypothetical protein R1sor_024515 [Riccia sorocarpa]|uniref:HNH homing endonuclease n=1 Tax=Riccia sorocarpa TaxID=122646 RepID=A0ABD3GWS4_9MARC